MTSFRKALVILLALGLVVGASAGVIAMPASGDCNASLLSVHHDLDCEIASHVIGCDVLCGAGSFAPAAPSSVVPDDSSLAACSAAAFPWPAPARAPDTAPPKRNAA
jgi:hypothetical protein